MAIAYEWVERAAAGANGAQPELDERFENEYRQWYGPLVALCRRQLRGQGDAEAIAQEAFVRAWLFQDRYTDGRPFWPWLTTIARRLCVNAMVADSRRRARDLRAYTSDLPQPWTVDDLTEAENADFDEALQQLPLKERRMLMLRHVDGMSYDEIARLHSVSIESVRGSLKRARATVRAAYERSAAGALGGLWLRRRWLFGRRSRPSTDNVGWFLGRWIGPEAFAMLGLLVAPASVAAPMPAAAPAAPPPVVEAAAPAPTTTTSTTVTASRSSSPRPAPVRPAVAPPPSADELAAAAGTVSDYKFAVSPSYSEDNTVFATGYMQCSLGSSCLLLLKSTDGGRSWTRLPAKGAAGGSILLPPAYPRDNRIFQVSGSDIAVSHDGGNTFTSVARHVNMGSAILSPGFSDGDPRILMTFLDHPMTAPMATEYHMDHGVTTPRPLPLPADARPTRLAFGPDGRMFVSVIEAPELEALGPERRGFSAWETSMYACSGDTCRKVMPNQWATSPGVVWGNDPGRTMFTWTGFSLWRSSDGGRTLTELAQPGTRRVRMVNKVVPAPGGRLVAVGFDGDFKLDTVLYESHDLGDTWTPLVNPGRHIYDFTVLPDGSMLVGTMIDGRPAIRCSADGISWAERCGTAA